MSSYKYRPEIDGLRAIAVLSVVIAHANHQWLPSGFLGVDVFFVISGFLITQIISQEMQQGTFSFLEFYKRRAKRLLPALLTVLSFTTAVSYFLFLKQDFIEYIKSLFASLLFSANLFFAKGVGYFDVSSQEKPLLHLWSLSVEEQFYFIFPVILLIAIKFVKNKLVWVVLGLIGLSLLSKFLPSFNLEQYYLPHIRAYELLIGSLFALLAPRVLPNWLQWLALVNIILFMILPSELFAFGGGYVERVMICVSTALLLWNTNQTTHNSLTPNRLLSHKFLIFFGLISYSLYLWHWVVLAFLRYTYMESQLSYYLIAIAILASIALAYLTYKFIENPIRKIKVFTTKHFILSMIGYFMLPILAISTWYADKKQLIQLNDKIPEELVWDFNTCHNKLPTQNDSCIKGDTSTQPKILIVGDSHTGQYNHFFDYIGKKEGWSSVVISADTCPFLIGVAREKGKTNYHECNLLREYVQTHSQDFDTVILANHWQFYTPETSKYETNFIQNFEYTLNYLYQNGKKVYIFRDNPLVDIHILRNYNFGNLRNPIISESSEQQNSLIKSISEKYPNVKWVDINPYIPKDFTIDGLPIYKDIDHINPYGARKLAEAFTQQEVLIHK